MTTVHEDIYLVTGATVRTGSQVILKLVQTGARVRALIHSTQPESLPGEGVEFVPGEYQNYYSLIHCNGASVNAWWPGSGDCSYHQLVFGYTI